MAINTVWLSKQVDEFAKVRSRFVTFTDVLKIVLMHAAEAVCEGPIVSARAKGVPNFARKCVRKYPRLYSDDPKKMKNPLVEFTDLCGARVIVPVQTQVQRLGQFVRDNFHIDVANSQDTLERLAPDEFGYRSVHYIVMIKREALEKLNLVSNTEPGKIRPADLDSIARLKGEIQLRTIAQHAWADFGHDLIYKSPFTVPRLWQRESARAAAQIEVLDDAIEEIVAGMRTLQTNAGNFMPKAEAEAEIENLLAIRKHAANDLSLVKRAARLQISIGEYEAAKELIEGLDDNSHLDLQCTLGEALCRLNRDHPLGEDYQRGREILRQVIEKSGRTHVEAMTQYADTFLSDDPAERSELFKQAYRAAPNDPQVLCGYLMNEVASTDNVNMLPLLRPNIDAAVRICQDQITARVNLPFALWYQSGLHLFRDEPMHALNALARAICLTPETQRREEGLSRLKKLGGAHRKLRGLKWCLDLLRLALSTPHKLHEDFNRRILLGSAVLTQPVAIIAGGCDPHHADRITGYQTLLEEGFKGFKGTIISGGTREGISGIAGGLLEKNPEITGVAYLPDRLGKTATEDPRYHHHPRTDREDDVLDDDHQFTPAQPIQSWIDLLAAGIDPKSVKLIGVDGGVIAEFEYHLAAALGAQVAIVRGSGRVADQLLIEALDPGNERLMFVPEDSCCVNAFIRIDGGKDPDVRFKDRLPKLAEGVHLAYNEIVQMQSQAKLEKSKLGKDAMQSRAFADSSRQQALDIDAKLRVIHKKAVPIKAPGTPITELTQTEIDLLAPIEHGRWVIERLRTDWRLGTENDDKKKTRVSLKSWADLNEEDRDKDRHAIKVIPKLLKNIGYKIVAESRATPPPPTKNRKSAAKPKVVDKNRAPVEK